MGPSFMVHLQSRLSAEALEGIDARLRAEMRNVARQGSQWEFWTHSGYCRSALSVVPLEEQGLEDDQIDAMTRALGYRPPECLMFHNFCRSDSEGHRELARFAASLVSGRVAMIDVEGTKVETYLPHAEIIHLPTGWRLITPQTLAEWSEHEEFYIEI